MGNTAKKDPSSQANVILLPECDDQSICIRLHGVVSAEDFEKIFLKPFKEIAAKNRKYSLLIHYASDYKGWSREAADLSFQSIIEYGKNARKLAYVNPPEAKLFQIKMARPLFGGEIRFFEEEDLAEALKWVKI